MEDPLEMTEGQPTCPPQLVDPRKRILTFAESFEYLGITPTKLAELSYEGIIPCYKPSENSLFYKRKDLEAWLLKHPYERYQEIHLPQHHCRYQSRNKR